jgi:tRNA threonylcarbamoyl adenosine modification protein YeaZ
MDLASHASCLACVEDSTVRSFLAIDGRVDDQSLPDQLKDVWNKAGWKPTDIERIACVTGPGGFTSLRVAVTAANVLADQLHVPIAGVHLSELFAARANVPMLWVHSTRKTHVFVRVFGMSHPSWDEPTLVELDELATFAEARPAFCGDLLPEHAAILIQEGCAPVELAPVEKILPEFVNGLVFGKGQILPWYGRGY